MFISCSTCFERHTARHQELKNCNGTKFALGLDNGRQTQTYVKPEAAITVFKLLMMGGMSLETCCETNKHWNSKF